MLHTWTINLPFRHMVVDTPEHRHRGELLEFIGLRRAPICARFLRPVFHVLVYNTNSDGTFRLSCFPRNAEL